MRMFRQGSLFFLSCDVALACNFWVSTICFSFTATDFLDNRLIWRVTTWNEKSHLSFLMNHESL